MSDRTLLGFVYLWYDRALTFDGTWPDVNALLDFKPWNKK